MSAVNAAAPMQELPNRGPFARAVSSDPNPDRLLREVVET
jgi:hypothetical protein